MLLRFQQNLWYIYILEDTLEHINLTVIDNYKCKKNHNVVGWLYASSGVFSNNAFKIFHGRHEVASPKYNPYVNHMMHFHFVNILYIFHLFGWKERRKEMFYLTTHSTHFIYGYMASGIW